jgi:hypothetical protein
MIPSAVGGAGVGVSGVSGVSGVFGVFGVFGVSDTGPPSCGTHAVNSART